MKRKIAILLQASCLWLLLVQTTDARLLEARLVLALQDYSLSVDYTAAPPPSQTPRLAMTQTAPPAHPQWLVRLRQVDPETRLPIEEPGPEPEPPNVAMTILGYVLAAAAAAVVVLSVVGMVAIIALMSAPWDAPQDDDWDNDPGGGIQIEFENPF